MTKKTFVTLPHNLNIAMFNEAFTRLFNNIEDIIGNQIISKVSFDEQINRIIVQSNGNTEDWKVPQITKKAENGTTSIIINNVYPVKAIDLCNMLDHIILCLTVMYQDKLTAENRKQQDLIKIIHFQLNKEQIILVLDQEFDLSIVEQTPRFNNANFGVQKNLFDFDEENLFSQEKHETVEVETVEEKMSRVDNEETVLQLNGEEQSENKAITTTELDNSITTNLSGQSAASTPDTQLQESAVQESEKKLVEESIQSLDQPIVEKGSTEDKTGVYIPNIGVVELQSQELSDSITAEVEPDSENKGVLIAKDTRSNESLMVVDGNNLLNRGYFATSHNTEESNLKRNSKGQFINGIESFIQQLNRYLKTYVTDSVVICFDNNNPFLENFRKQMYPEYKETRNEKPVSLIQQLDMIIDVVETLNIPYIMDTTGYYEADDLIGSVITKWRKRSSGPIYIVSNDKDLYQLLDNNTCQILKKSEDVLYSLEDFTKEYGITTKQWIDVKSVIGDSSDNIRGVSGIGDKYIFDMLRDFGGLQDIYERLDELRTHPKYKRYASKFEQQQKEAFLSLSLVTIVCNEQIECIDNLDLNALSTNNISNLEKGEVYRTLGW